MPARATLLAFVLCAAQAAAQQAEPPAARRGELAARYWLSSGETKRSHNAQGVAPMLGNPTSVLLYEDLDASVLELFGRANFAGAWFLKASVGLGQVNRGSFDDEDFLAGQAKFSDTTSAVTHGRIAYGTLDIGRNEWALRRGRSVLGAFVGYSQWTESLDAYGATDHLGAIGGDIGPEVRVISNKVTWKSVRIGLAADFAVGGRTRMRLDLGLVPYSRARDEDSHHLRSDPGDLGPVPNILLEGRGRGVQLDAELGYAIARRTELALGVRAWHLEATRGVRRLPHRPDVPALPLVDLYSTRYGATLSLRRLW